MNDIIIQFRKLAKQSWDVLEANYYDCRKVEPYYVKVLEFVKEHPECRSAFIKEFMGILGSKGMPWELIQFCMRELQWQEIKDAVLLKMKEEIAGNHDWRIISVLSSILEVYEEEWEDSDLYLYYSKNGKN